MQHKKKEPIEWLEFEQLSEFPELVHGVFLRKGGVSNPPYDALNIGECTDDDPRAVFENRQRILSILGIPKYILPNSCHGSDLEIVSSDANQFGPCDGLITQAADLGLLVTHADCQAALFYDPKNKVIANVHCGWRGNVQNIYEKTVGYFRKNYQTNPRDLLVCISPSLGPNAAQFVNYQKEFPQSFSIFQHRPFYFDLWEISKAQLMQAGVLKSHIEIAKICTYQNENDFFSHRREKKTGRNGTLIAMRKI